MGWDHLRKPSGGPGHGPARGPSLGGEAKGKSTGKGYKLFEPGNTASAAVNRTGGTTYRRMAKEERIGTLEDLAFQLATQAEAENVRNSMTQYLMNREMGAPTARQEVTGKDGGPIEVDSPGERIASRLAGLTARGGTPSNTE